MSEKENKLSAEASLALHNEGKDKWNAYMEEHPNTWVWFVGEIENCNFRGYVFSGYADFGAATFSSNADFHEATFSSDAHFHEATFSSYANFGDATFSSNAYFNNATFSSDADFNAATFSNYALFISSSFKGDVSFIGAKFSNVPFFHGSKFPSNVINEMSVTYQTEKTTPEHIRNVPQHRFLKRAKTSSDADRYRLLKRYAIEDKNHDQEQKFFAMEMKAKRGHHMGVIASILNIIYGLVSNFGFSIVRPFFCWIATICSSGAGFHSLATVPIDCLQRYLLSLIYGVSTSLPFGGMIRRSETVYETLFTDVGSWEPSTQLWFYGLLALNGIFGSLFLFLIGLGFRNRFRL